MPRPNKNPHEFSDYAMFLLSAFALFALVAALLLFPLLRPGIAKAPAAAAQREMTLAILRSQLAELEAEKAAGTLSEASFAASAEDLQRRILDEAANAQTAPAVAGESRRLADTIAPLLVCLVLGVGGLTGYLFLGSPAALSPEARAAAPATDAPVTREQIEAMVAGLAERLQANPGDLEGWITLGQSYRVLNRPAEAAAAYAKAESRIAQDAALLVEYAEVLAAAQGHWKGKPEAQLAAARKLAPEYGQAIFLSGVAAYENGDKLKAADFWEQLLPRAKETDEATYNLLVEKIAQLRAEAKAEKQGKKRQ
ncbi:MAG: c-type cytochrome biogenesis protein CcmI [Zoogloeaceae bacterium]|jgi:cytochrome c-type biogenesis protein CcmH|nr:c-type cytochrome biogenesis protein CcmI [Zoogloeaceae bacterium]